MRTMLRRSRPYRSSRCSSVITSYGGASTPPSFTCSGLYRVPSKGSTVAMRVRPSEPHLAELIEPCRLAHFLEQVGADGVIDFHLHHGVSARPVAAELDACDVDVVAREQCGDRRDDTRAVLMGDDEERAARLHVDAEVVDARDPRSLVELRAGDEQGHIPDDLDEERRLR